MAKAATGITAQIVEEVAKCGIQLVASLPDTWISDLIEAFDKDKRFLHVPVNREESAIGLCSGAFFSGTGSLALMGASGFMTCIYGFDSLDSLKRDFDKAVLAPGHTFVVLEVEAVGKKLQEPPMDGPEMKYRFGRYIERVAGVRVFDDSLK